MRGVLQTARLQCVLGSPINNMRGRHIGKDMLYAIWHNDFQYLSSLIVKKIERQPASHKNIAPIKTTRRLFCQDNFCIFCSRLFLGQCQVWHWITALLLLLFLSFFALSSSFFSADCQTLNLQGSIHYVSLQGADKIFAFGLSHITGIFPFLSLISPFDSFIGAIYTFRVAISACRRRAHVGK